MQKYLVMSIFCCTFALAFGKEVTQIKLRAFSSAGLEHLPYKQRVGGSNPSTSTDEEPAHSVGYFFLRLRVVIFFVYFHKLYILIERLWLKSTIFVF